VNDNGQVTGEALTSQGQNHAFRYTDGVGMVDLESQAQFQNLQSVGNAINNPGQTAGNGGGQGHRGVPIHRRCGTAGRG